MDNNKTTTRNDAREKLILDKLATDVGGIMVNGYFRAALYRGDKQVSLAGLMQTTGMPSINHNGVLLYGNGRKGSTPAVDRQLQAEYELFKRGLLNFSDMARKVFRLCGTNERTIVLNAMAARQNS